MHRLTCNDADRLAADLDRAAVQLRSFAAQHNRYASGLAVVGDFRWAGYHERAAQDATDDAQQLADYAKRLRDRTPLWPAQKAPSQVRARRPDSMKPTTPRRAA